MTRAEGSEKRALRILLAPALAALLALIAPSAWASAQDEIDRSTPRRTMAAFLVATGAHDFAGAAALLDLGGMSPESRRVRGPLLAEQLAYVLDRNVWIDPGLLNDQPEGNASDGSKIERVAVVRAGTSDVPITLSRRPDGNWAISTSTVAAIPRLYAANGPGYIESRVPMAFRARAWGLAAWQWLGLLVALVSSLVIGRAMTFLGARVGGRLASKTDASWDDELIEALRRPARFLFGVLAFSELRAALALSAAASEILSRLLSMVTIGAVSWAVIGLISVVSRVVERRAMASADGVGDADLRARGVKTQVRVLRRVINISVGIIAVALMLTQFEVVRSIGVSLLASAGVAGVVLGFAAQRTIGSLIAGIQLSFTQPIRIGDVVIIEKEWGTIEEVTLTFVVVRVWDERRLIVPMSRFLEHPFENWTKVSPDLHGTVFFHVDWRLSADDLRRELDRIVASHPCWDGRTKSVCVTNVTDRTIEMRALVSAANADDLWNLRIHVREKIVAWLQQHEGGKYLPRVRLEGSGPDAIVAR